MTAKLKQLEELEVIDMRQANRAIHREKHPVPTVEETLQEISEEKVFGKLDLNMAFYQIELLA